VRLVAPLTPWISKLLLAPPRVSCADYETGDFVEKPKRRTLTSPGLGDSGLHARQVVPTVPPSPRDAGVRDPSGDRSAEGESIPPASAEKISGRRPRTSRPPVRVDDVGDVAVAIASRASLTFAPRLLKSRNELTHAPIDPRDAFVLSLIDGKSNVAAIVDISGMASVEIAGILQRLAGLGIVALH
jgi:hypothetical protein